ncbi:putative glycolipid-binding domain-containing protein [Nocardia sp. NPDC056000]|uniref:putative glycolipid-binding domain-containing protein n=1 Tax=Nocardia sp. NPDC056000 TaxID=3345674 RepID=UPI0035DBE625
MTFTPPPASAAWSHSDARSGFEVAYFERLGNGLRIEGCTTAIELGETWIVEYRIALAPDWSTRAARITSRTRSGQRSIKLETDGTAHWLVNGAPAPHLDGCLDIDLESSAMTNAFPIHRLNLSVGANSPAPAAYIRATDLTVDRLEQHYERIPDSDGHHRYEYAAPVFDFTGTLIYDASGLVVDYPGIATRAV